MAEVVIEDRWSSASIQISDCDRKISLEFDLGSADQYENDLYKVDTLIKSLQKFRRALNKHHKKP